MIRRIFRRDLFSKIHFKFYKRYLLIDHGFGIWKVLWKICVLGCCSRLARLALFCASVATITQKLQDFKKSDLKRDKRCARAKNLERRLTAQKHAPKPHTQAEALNSQSINQAQARGEEINKLGWEEARKGSEKRLKPTTTIIRPTID
jgi:hypothetical protein